MEQEEKAKSSRKGGRTRSGRMVKKTCFTVIVICYKFAKFNCYGNFPTFRQYQLELNSGSDRFRPEQISSHVEILTDFVPFFNIKTNFVPFLTDFVPNNYYNVVSYVHISLVP